MAGVNVYIGISDPERLQDSVRRLKFFEEAVVTVCDAGFCAAWIGHDDPNLFAPASDPKTGVRVVSSGRVSWDESEWRRSEHISAFEGGLSNRLLLERYITGGPSALDRHNGPAALVVWDPRTRKVHLWTDHFGYHPVFLYRPEDLEHAIISTFPDAIAGDAKVSVSPDEASMVEFLSAWRITPPYTYYREIKYAGAATHWTWDLQNRRVSKRVYWRPYQEVPFPNMAAATEELAFAVGKAIKIRTLPRLGPTICYASGGMDSRTVLFSSADPGQMVALNLYDVPNKEASVSQRLAAASNTRYEGFARDSDYYPRWHSEGARLSGAMWSTEDNHFLGTRERVRQLGARTVMTACTTDWLFKGYGLERTYAKLFGRNLPLKNFTERRINGFLPNKPRPVPAAFKKVVAERLEEWFEGTPTILANDADWLAVEDRRVRPACYTVSVSGQIMYRIFPYDTFLADTNIADCYSKCRAEWKLNSELWGQAVRRICAGGIDIEDANFGWRVGSSAPMKLAAFACGWLKRRIQRSEYAADGLANDGSWPNLGWYLRNSSTISRMWADTPNEIRITLASYWGSNPWDTTLNAWSVQPNDFFRLLTLSSHLGHRVTAPLLNHDNV